MGPDRSLLEALTGPHVVPSLRALDAGGTLTQLIPELEAGRGFQQPELHFYDVLDHNLAAVAALEAVIGDGPDGREFREHLAWVDIDESLSREIDGIPLLALTRLGCLLHDVAKPATATMVDGRLRFPRHGPVGAELMADRLALLGFGEDSRRFVCAMIRYHLRPGELVRAWPPSDHAVRRFVTALEGHVLPLMLVNIADGMATRGPRYTRENYRRHCSFVNYVVSRAVSVMQDDRGESLITGDDLIADLHLSGGRLLGAVLTSVRRAHAEGVITTRDEALAYARAALARLSNAEG